MSELQTLVAELEAEVATWRARHSRLSCVLNGGKPKSKPKYDLDGLERLALRLVEERDQAEAEAEAARREIDRLRDLCRQAQNLLDEEAANREAAGDPLYVEPVRSLADELRAAAKAARQ